MRLSKNWAEGTPPPRRFPRRTEKFCSRRMLKDRAVFDRDDGSATLEFITAGMILLLPMVYLILVMSQLQGGSFAVEGAARQAARIYVQSTNPATALAAAQRAVDFAMADAGIVAPNAVIDVRCSPKPRTCLTRNGTVTVAVRLLVPLPLIPAALDMSTPLAVPLEASASQKVSRFWGATP